MLAVSPRAWHSAAVVAAYRDDEVLGVGGTMALLAAVGTRLRLIAVMTARRRTRRRPGGYRRTRIVESAAALAVLGVPGIEVVRPRFPDTALAAARTS